MKRIILLFIIIISYILFISFQLSHDGGHHEAEGVSDIVIGHLADHPIEAVTVNTDDNFFMKYVKAINNFIAVDINEKRLNRKLFGIFDMRITKVVVMMWIVVFICALIFIPLARRIKKDKMGTKSKWVNLWEALIGFVHDEIVEPNFESKYVKRAMPYLTSLFFFILFCNFIGLIPGMATATGNLAVTGGLALFTLTGMIGVGIVRQGPLWFYKGLVPRGVPFVLGVLLLFPIELFGIIIKPFALTMRLFANMTAGHLVIIIFLYLVVIFENYAVGVGSVFGSLMIYMLELLVGFIQAYIFTVLTAMFIGSSMHAH